jgi:hypothetical protein
MDIETLQALRDLFEHSSKEFQKGKIGVDYLREQAKEYADNPIVSLRLTIEILNQEQFMQLNQKIAILAGIILREQIGEYMLAGATGKPN